MSRTCEELGVCQNRCCPDCEAFECELPCSPEPARPTFPFAPGTIDGPHRSPVTQRGLLVDLVWLLVCVGGLGMLMGYLLERFA
ncbi:hypothetical protein [Rhodoferax sp.]|uniref:hypothetical protein n=1 Tax=Rhodoferax sp. TaxID=50421 RepID=UPI0025DB7F35|nr:hypothetical protein [Rhodoferax sp.]MCM2340437.1 hypothetical protein [Rhodoferax sp.]